MKRWTRPGRGPVLAAGVVWALALAAWGPVQAAGGSTAADGETARNVAMPLETEVAADGSTADHSRFEELDGPFDNGAEVTEACLDCHTEAGKHVQKSIHWTWEYSHPETGQELGKRHLINNFCTNARDNEGMCLQCHASYGWRPDDFKRAALDWRQRIDRGSARHVDCLVCHEQTGTYYKLPPTRGEEACARMFEDRQPRDWAKIAQSVDMPDRDNCGTCHFYGGGGDGVKHGDLDSSLTDPSKALDVHMSPAGEGFACQRCHVSDRHQLAGSRYAMIAKDTAGRGKPGLRRHAASCESCHGARPHPVAGVTGMKLNDHVDRVACPTCHVPEIARGGVATKLAWDWRTAGRTRNGEGYKVKGYVQGDGTHRATYKSIKGSFEYGENLVPHYAWFDGQMHYTTVRSRFDPAKEPIEINGFDGSADDPASRIWPFKRMHTVQPYDTGNDRLVYMQLWGDDGAAYWGNYDFARAIEVGMTRAGLPYSGEYGFIETYSYWPITHMVAPAEDAVACRSCHSAGGRLARLTDIYLPGRAARAWVDWLGLGLVAAAGLGVLGHAGLRIVSARRRS